MLKIEGAENLIPPLHVTYVPMNFSYMDKCEDIHKMQNKRFSAHFTSHPLPNEMLILSM